MSTSFQSEIGKIQRIILKSPEQAFISQDFINHQWKDLNYTSPPIFAKACIEFSDLHLVFLQLGIETHLLPGNAKFTIDSIYCRDASILTDEGAILCRMGKSARQGEQEELAIMYKSLDIPILGQIIGNGLIEGGDTFWLNQHTLVVGRGYRTNSEGITQLKELAADRFKIVEVPLPHYKGPQDVFHLMSIISPIDKNLLLVYSPLMPVVFRELLLDLNYHLIEVPNDEFETMGVNVLTLEPGVCLMLEGNPVTKTRLEHCGVKVITYSGLEISVKGCGGPTCLTRPLERIC